MCCIVGTTEYLALSICKIFRTGEGGGCSFDRVQKDYAAASILGAKLQFSVPIVPWILLTLCLVT